jgi:transposase
VSVGADSAGVGLSLHGYSLDDIARLTDTAVRGCPGVSQGKAFADWQVAADAIVDLLATTSDPPPAGWLVSAGRWAIRHNIATERRHHGRRHGQATTNFARYWAHPQPRSDPSFVEHIVEGVALAQVWQVLPAAHRVVLGALAACGDRHAAAAALGVTLSAFEERLTAARSRFLRLWFDHETPRRRVFDETARQHARRLRAQGYSVRRVAGKLGVTTTTIHEWTRGVRPEGSNGYRGPLPRQRAQARRMRAQGHTPTEIAVIVGVHPVTVRRWTADITVAS